MAEQIEYRGLMPSFKEMDPDLIQSLLEGRKDALQAEVNKEEAFFRACVCPRCGDFRHETRLNTKTPFTPGSPLARKVLKCSNCMTEFDPYTGLIHSVLSEIDPFSKR
jgi:hypothetical protein